MNSFCLRTVSDCFFVGSAVLICPDSPHWFVRLSRKGAKPQRDARDCLRAFASWREIPPSVQIALALPAGIVDVNYFQFGIEVQRGRALFTIADAGALDAAERNVRFT